MDTMFLAAILLGGIGLTASLILAALQRKG